MIKPKCDKCNMEINEPGGGLAIAPPQTEWPWKFHLCITCWIHFKEWLNIVPNTVYEQTFYRDTPDAHPIYPYKITTPICEPPTKPYFGDVETIQFNSNNTTKL